MFARLQQGRSLDLGRWPAASEIENPAGAKAAEKARGHSPVTL